MRRGTTPVNSFDIPLKKDEVTALTVTYVQDKAIVLKMKLKDVELKDYKIIINLSQEETLKFEDTKRVKIQIKMKDTSEKIHLSDIIYTTVGEVLDEEVM